MDAKTYELMTSADVTIEHVFSLFAPYIDQYSLHLVTSDYPIDTREINLMCDTNNGRCVLGFTDDDAQLILAISDKRVTRCWMTQEPPEDGDVLTATRVHIIIEL